MAYAFVARADWLDGCSRHPVLVVRVQVHNPLHISVSTILLALKRFLQGVDSSRCRWLCGTPACSYRPVIGPCASVWFPGSTETYLTTLGFSVSHPPPWAPSSGALFSIEPFSPGPPQLLFREC